VFQLVRQMVDDEAIVWQFFFVFQSLMFDFDSFPGGLRFGRTGFNQGFGIGCFLGYRIPDT
jgi:hypothetical protein